MLPLSRLVRSVLPFAAAAAVGIAVVGCSGSIEVGNDAVSQSEVESQAAKRLAESVDSGTIPDVSCPGDLDSEVGATMTCELTVEGDDALYPVEIEVTEVNDDVASFSIQVGDAPTG